MNFDLTWTCTAGLTFSMISEFGINADTADRNCAGLVRFCTRTVLCVHRQICIISLFAYKQGKKRQNDSTTGSVIGDTEDRAKCSCNHI